MGTVSGALAATGAVSAGVTLIRTFNVDFGGNATGVVVLERSFDGGATYFERKRFAFLNGEMIRSSLDVDPMVLREDELCVTYRVRMRELTSGSLTYRLAGPSM